MKRDNERGGEIVPLRTIPSARRAAIEAGHHARMMASIANAETREARKRELWGPIGSGSMERLCALFHSLDGVPGTRPWDAMVLLKWLCTSPGVSHGSSHAAKFVLRVWNSYTNWDEAAHEEKLLKKSEHIKPFDMFEALACWDGGNAAAFRAWVEVPFWP